MGMDILKKKDSNKYLVFDLTDKNKKLLKKYVFSDVTVSHQTKKLKLEKCMNKINDKLTKFFADFL